MHKKKQNMQKKTWVISMFSQLSHLENESNSPKRRKYDEIIRPTSSGRERCKMVGEIIDIDEPDHNNDTISNKQSSTFLKNTHTDVQIENDNWIVFFAPRNSEELAIHPKKRQELQQWFQHCSVMKRKKPAQLCLLTGPSGCGKTAAVHILAKENNFCIQEWINPIDQDGAYSLEDHIYKSFVCSQKDLFKNFLFKASRYRSLLEINSKNNCLLLVEDFPNFLLKDPTAFQEILEDYSNYAKSPLIFIVTDSKARGLNINYNIFTEEIKQKFHINHISFNAVALTNMQKSMKRFCTLMRSPFQCRLYTPPTADIVDSIVLSAQGDVRNALINLHFSSLKGAPNLLTTKRLKNVEDTKASRKKKCDSTLTSLGRNESITMMHALGRIFNPKYTEDKIFLHSPEKLSEDFVTEPKKFIDLVQKNYLSHFCDVEYVAEAANGLSLCDNMLNEYRDDSLAIIGLNLGIRTVMVANTNPVVGWMPIKGQTRINFNTAKFIAQTSRILPKHHNISSSIYAVDYKTFVNIISP